MERNYKISNLSLYKLANGEFFVNDNQKGNWIIAKKEELPLIRKLAEGCGEKELICSKRDVAKIKLMCQSGLVTINDKKRFTYKNYIQTKKPFHLVLNLSNNCNMSCAYCYVNASPSRDKGIIIKNAEKIIREMLKGQKEITVVFHGGEPLLQFEKIKRIIYYAERIRRNKKINFRIQTNGTLLNEKIIEYLKEKGVSIGISCDITPAAHEKIRVFNKNASTYNHVIRAFENLTKKNVKFSVIMVLHKENKQCARDIFKFVRKYGIRRIAINPLFSGGRGDKNILGISNEEYFSFMKSYLRAQVQYNRDTPDKVYETETNFLIRNLLHLDYTYMCKSNPCGASFSTVAIDPSGDVYPCDEFCGEKKFRGGNIAQKSLEEIKKSGSFKRVRSIKKNKKCSSCVWYHYCTGGCPSKTYYNTGSFKNVSAYCGYYKKIIPYIVHLINAGKIDIQDLYDGGKNKDGY